MPKSDSLLSGKRCFVLDDEFLIALDIQQILERAGAAHVTSVASAAEAVALLGREPKFDVAVLDVKLGDPERNSLDVAALLQTQGTPFVFLTGMRVDDVHAKVFPNAPVIEKPYDATGLLRAVQRALIQD
ncbi:MAG TPA: response regulator [Pseudolabrys sp.]|nr:response regulator [Pseudolabrys sp.]